MSDPNPSPRTGKEISQPLDRQLKLYAIAASAAGVSLLAFVKPADAEIVYTPAHAQLPLKQFDFVDLNADGVPDFRFIVSTFAYHSFNASLRVKGLGGGAVATSAGAPAVLPRGATIGSSKVFTGGDHVMAHSFGFDYLSNYSRHTYGPWNNVQNRYLGVSFTIAGQLHYGWVRMSVSFRPFRPMKAIVTGYAYETEANKPLRAGQTSGNTAGGGHAKSTAPAARGAASLGMLAGGTGLLPMWRREDEAAIA